jgi:hypothetical protein
MVRRQQVAKLLIRVIGFIWWRSKKNGNEIEKSGNKLDCACFLLVMYLRCL